MSLICGFAGLRRSAAREPAGQSEVVCVRGANEPKSQCALTSEFAI